MNKIKFLMAVMISVLPFSIVRVTLYKLFMQYDIHSSKIGWGTVIAIDSFSINHVSIGSLNLFTGPFSFKASPGCFIGGGNIFRCGKWAGSAAFADRDFGRSMSIGRDVTITNKHYFDVVGNLIVGNDSWIAGYGSQFWTHGGNKKEIDIHIGVRCYLGSAVRFAPGACVADGTIVGLGSVVTKKFYESDVMIAGNPASIKKTDYNWQDDLR